MKKGFLKKIAVLSAFIMTFSACSEKPSDTSSPDSGKVSKPSETLFNEAKGDFTGNIGDVSLEKGDTYAVISVEGFGDIKIKLFPEAAPYGVKNFTDLANSGFYTGKNIHRVMSNFMFQGGSLNGNGTGGEAAEGGEFGCEINSAMRHFYGALCYANAGGMNSCQFYIVNSKETQADLGKYYDSTTESYEQYKSMFEEVMKGYSKGTNEYRYYSMQVDSIKSSIKGWKFMKERDKDGLAAKKYAEVGGTPFLDGGYTVFGQTVEGFDVIDAISAVEVKDSGSGETSKPVNEILISSVTIHTM